MFTPLDNLKKQKCLYPLVVEPVETTSHNFAGVSFDTAALRHRGSSKHLSFLFLISAQTKLRTIKGSPSLSISEVKNVSDKIQLCVHTLADCRLNFL